MHNFKNVEIYALNPEVRGFHSPAPRAQAWSDAMAMSVAEKPALQIFANARMCFNPYWVNAPHFASKMRTCMAQNQVLETMMQYPYKNKKRWCS
jgi:hypothetical protein